MRVRAVSEKVAEAARAMALSLIISSIGWVFMDSPFLSDQARENLRWSPLFQALEAKDSALYLRMDMKVIHFYSFLSEAAKVDYQVFLSSMKSSEAFFSIAPHSAMFLGSALALAQKAFLASSVVKAAAIFSMAATLAVIGAQIFWYSAPHLVQTLSIMQGETLP